VIELLRGYFLIEPNDDTRRIRERVTSKLLSLDRSLDLALPPLFSLLDVPVEDETWLRLNPPRRRQRTLDSLKRLFLREAEVQPLILVFEDLHWIDGGTQALLDGLVESLPTARVLLLVNYRPQYGHAWGSKTYYGQLRIDALPPASAAAFLETLLGNDSTLVPLVPLLIERTEGNPFFLEESVRTLAETGILVGQPHAYRLTRTPASLRTAQAIIAARVDRLDPGDKRLLQAASVLGRDVPLTLLEAIADIREDELRQRLSRLQAAEFLYETRLFPEVEYTFKHALTHEATYASLLQERRRALHASIVDTIEQMYQDRLAAHIERLAYHSTRGEIPNKAWAYSRDCGVKAMSRSAYPEAVVYFEQALAALQQLPDSRERNEQEFDLWVQLRGGHFANAEPHKAREDLDRAEALADQLGSEPRLALLSCSRSMDAWAAGDHRNALAHAERALTIGTANRDVRIQARAREVVGRACHHAGDYSRAIEILRENVSFLVGDLESFRSTGINGIISVFSRDFLAWCLAEIGEFAESAALAEESVRIAEAAQDQHSLISAYQRGLGRSALARGDMPKAVEAFRRARQVCLDADIRVWRHLTSSALALAYARAGRGSEIEDLLENADGYRGPEQVAHLLYVAESRLLTDRNEAAHEAAGGALNLAVSRGERGHQAWALWLLGECVSKDHRVDSADAAVRYHQAFGLASALGMRLLVAHCHLGLGKLYRRTGKHEQAHEHLTTATTMYREMGMTYWLEKAQAEIKDVAR
jgi:tetratricopeptide (TPR) repeat protein